MSENLYPDATIQSSEGLSLFVFGAPSVHQALDSATASYVAASGPAFLIVSLADPTMTDDQFVAVTVGFDARPVAAFAANLNLPVVGELIDRFTSTVYARSTWTYDGSSGFKPAVVEFGSVVNRSLANNLWLRIYMGPRGLYTHQYEANDARMIASTLFDPPVATATGPTGGISDNTPTLQWTATVDDPAHEFEIYGRWRVFSAAQYGAFGFNPETSAATWDSGLRAVTTHAVTSAPLDAGTYRAYVAAYQKIVAGSPWGGRPGATSAEAYPLQAGLFGSFVQFQILPVVPPVAPPAIPIDVVRDLTETQRATLLEATRPIPRVTLYTADGVFVRELSIVTPSSSKVTLDAASQIRGTLDLVVSDVDIVPANRKEASGENLPLHPFGSYVHVSYGLRDGRFGTIYVGVGVFRLSSVKRDRAAGKVTIQGKDFALNLQESRFAYPVTRQDWDTTPPTPFLVTDVASLIVNEAGLPYRVTANAARVVANYAHKITDDRPKALDDLAGAISGFTWYADIDGVIYFGPGPDITTDAIAYTFLTADPGQGRLVAQIQDREQELTRDAVFDTVVAYDQAVTIIGGAYDQNPDSVIRRSAANPAALSIGSGAFSPGGKPFFYSSPTIASLPGAQSAAQTRLRGVALPAERISATCTPIPDLRPDKMVSMARDGETALVKWQVVKTVLPLTIGPQMTWDGATLAEDVVAAS